MESAARRRGREHVDIRHRYMHEPKLMKIVDSMLGLLAAGEIDAPDLARAAVLASQLYAERYMSPIVLALEEIPSWITMQAIARSQDATMIRELLWRERQAPRPRRDVIVAAQARLSDLEKGASE